jgi:hypothetical protein
MATEKANVVPEGIDPDASPFALQAAIEGFPPEKESEEARAIREVIEQADRERAEESSSSLRR